MPSVRGAAAGARLGRLLVRSGWSVHVRGAEHVPARGPVILAANHTNFLDGPLLFSVSPRPVHCLAMRDLFHGPLGRLLTAVGQVPIDRDGADPAGLRAALEVLRAGLVLGVFPEGTRAAGGEFTQVRLGVAWFAVRSGAPVVPVACLGVGARGRTLGSLPRPRSRLEVAFGTPITVEVTGLSGRARLDAAAEQVERGLRDHLSAARAAMTA